MSAACIEQAPATNLDAIDWPARLVEKRAEHIALGMQPDYAAQGAWWLVMRDAIDAGHAADPYEAEVFLLGMGATPPHAGKFSVWATTRPGDFLSPGTSSPREEAAGPPPAKPVGWSLSEFLLRHRPQHLDRVMTAWRDCHGFAEVAPGELHERVRFAFGGSKADEWTAEDFGQAIDKTVIFQATPDGRRLMAFDRARRDWPAARYALRFPAEPLRPAARDAALQPWQDRMLRRIDEMRDDPAFQPGEELPMRLGMAGQIAFCEVVEALAAERGCDRNSAEGLLRGAGVTP